MNKKANLKGESIVPAELIERRIYLIRGQKVMLSSDLAEMYSVETRVLNQAVKRNQDRFPDDFVFQLTKEEAEKLVSQNVIPHIKYFGGSSPFAFTEQGVAMLSGVLKSQRAIQVNIAIMRTFVKLRKLVSAHKELSEKLVELEQRIAHHDLEIRAIFDAIRQLMQPPENPRRKIGFHAKEKKARYETK